MLQHHATPRPLTNDHHRRILHRDSEVPRNNHAFAHHHHHASQFAQTALTRLNRAKWKEGLAPMT